ncbi:structure-specific endonuclease subunit slx1 [Phtheirospermum japonicum]|uniref:Structure-specific endonuclease subunit slx1 n=1 Tax=Phtheirospermum japonicum TaxID=374723 RepID=A0A830BHP6_9LAMI|nr:structure-specific endonuclease subunit slx1 [Phtheirospermum japonicum]
MARLSTTFKSLKSLSKSVPTLVSLPTLSKSSKIPSQILPPSSSSSKKPSSSVPKSPTRNSWTVYLILSLNPPIKTYVGVTNNFSNRLKQHNGELKGGAKASRAGRPWICACLIQGFINKSKAYEFESKWKSISRKLPRKISSKNQEKADNSQPLLLQHRYAALNKVKDLIDCSCLEINWRLDPM